jgi:hypothetical protein
MDKLVSSFKTMLSLVIPILESPMYTNIYEDRKCNLSLFIMPIL